MVETVLLLCKKGPLAVQGVVIQEKKYGFRGACNKILILRHIDILLKTIII